MDIFSILNSFLALLFVLGLVVLVGYLLRRFDAAKLITNSKKQNKRVSVTDVTVVDGKRKIILVKRDDVEHLVLLGPEKDIVIESGIKKKK